MLCSRQRRLVDTTEAGVKRFNYITRRTLFPSSVAYGFTAAARKKKHKWRLEWCGARRSDVGVFFFRIWAKQFVDGKTKTIWREVFSNWDFLNDALLTRFSVTFRGRLERLWLISNSYRSQVQYVVNYHLTERSNGQLSVADKNDTWFIIAETISYGNRPVVYANETMGTTFQSPVDCVHEMNTLLLNNNCILIMHSPHIRIGLILRKIIMRRLHIIICTRHRIP